jgi:hypothetical protein
MSERIEALLYLATHGERMLHATAELRHKVDAVRRAQGTMLAAMKKDITNTEANIARYEEINNPEVFDEIIKQAEAELDVQQRAMEQYENDSDHILEWLRRTDPELYEAAVKDGKSEPSKHFGCNCTRGLAIEAQKQEHKKWVRQLERQFHEQEHKAGVQTRNAKKRHFDHAMRYDEPND